VTYSGVTDTAAALYRIIHSRRDVRTQFTGGPVPDETLQRILAAAHAAPSVGLSQPWDFLIIGDRAIRQCFREHVQAERDAFTSQLVPDRADLFKTIRIDGVLEASLSLVVTYDERRGSPAVLGRHAMPDTGPFSVCLAIQNLWLAATAEGLGVGWVSFYREAFVQQLLHIPEGIRPLAWLCLGRVTHLEQAPDLERAHWRSRRPLDDVVHIDRW
jgi:5,6-dimethylbenzimidazole synthase